MTTVQPAAKAAPAILVNIAKGKFHWGKTCQSPRFAICLEYVIGSEYFSIYGFRFINGIFIRITFQPFARN